MPTLALTETKQIERETIAGRLLVHEGKPVEP